MAEFLIQAKAHWMDALPAEQITADKLDVYNARGQVGDIVVVKPDGWQWGKEECLPNFIVVKVPGVTVEQVQHYQNKLLDENGKLLKKYKHRVPDTTIANALKKNQSVITVDGRVLDNIIEKLS